MPDRIVHIGYPKTATTSIQKGMLPAVTDVVSVPRNEPNARICMHLCWQDPSDYDEGFYRDWLAQYEHPDKNLVLSFEGFTGDFLRQHCNRTQIAQRLHALGFNKVIITLRNQASFLNSMYNFTVRTGMPMSYYLFFTLMLSADKTHYFRSQYRFHPNYLDYFRLATLYGNLFGKENVHLLLMEELIADKESFIGKFFAAIGSRHNPQNTVLPGSNPSLCNASIKLLRVANMLTFTPFRPDALISRKINAERLRYWLDRKGDKWLRKLGSKKKDYLKAAQKQKKCEALYQPSNAKLFETFGLPAAYHTDYFLQA